jgi:hypothetical protein
MGLVARVVRRLEETMPDEARLQPDEEAFEFIWANFFPHNLREEVEPVISSSPAWENAHRALSLFITYQRQHSLEARRAVDRAMADESEAATARVLLEISSTH